jgi:hypothetical protein
MNGKFGSGSELTSSLFGIRRGGTGRELSCVTFGMRSPRMAGMAGQLVAGMLGMRSARIGWSAEKKRSRI